jgi:glycosyltransferase involved in cell wall biosynthesis
MTVTAVIPSIPPRARMLRQAVASVLSQTRPVDAISIAIDHNREGSAATRNRALFAASTEWCAFIDDDDQWKANHVERLLATAQETNADVVYPWPEMNGMTDPRPDRFGKPFDPDELRRGSYIPVTSLVRTKLAQECGGFHFGPNSPYDDHAFYLAMLDAGAKFVHLPERTWIWNVLGQNTSGRPDRW